MKDGFVKVAALSPMVQVADPKENSRLICEMLDQAEEHGAKIMVFPELSLTGFTCGDLFFQETLLQEAKEALLAVAAHTEGREYLAFVGLPVSYNGKLYNVAAAVGNGYVYGLVPKTHLSNAGTFPESRIFASGMEVPVQLELNEAYMAPMGTRLLFGSASMPELKIGAEICEDLWAVCPPSAGLAQAGATLIVNLAASIETPGSACARRQLVQLQSERLHCGYLFVNAGEGESTQDVVFAGQKLIAEDGEVLCDSQSFGERMVYTELDVNRLSKVRHSDTLFVAAEQGYLFVGVDLQLADVSLSRRISPSPFIPEKEGMRRQYCQEILQIQSYGLKRRLEHTHSQTAVVGISGGLDSTLALLVTAKAFELLGKEKKEIIAVTMPGFGTTDRTYENAVSMIHSLGATFKEISIRSAVNIHFCDIEHDPSKHDVTYENAQARERTQILMDVANMNQGLVIGTGDLSELALGWATYNGDHMSNYSVNGSVPKTLVRHLVRYYADTCGDEKLAAVLYDVLDTPVSPELLPSDAGKIAQKTEDLVGPYELHDFYIYYALKYGFSPAKIYRLAQAAFAGVYDGETIKKWLKTFYRRFVTQQFKRSCLPDGPLAGPISVSPRGGLFMPSDACARIWLDGAERL